YETASACITAEHKTLLVTQRPGGSENVRRGFPHLVSVQNDDNRKMKEMVAAAKGAGFFPAKAVWRLGILSDECSPGLYDSPTDGLKAYLVAAGVREWTEYRGACDLPSAQRGGAEAVLRFNQDHVTHVLVAAGVGNVRAYLSAAGAAGYRPKHFTGDYLNMASGHLAKELDPRSFDGAVGVTQTHAGEGVLGRPLPALAQKCSKILTDHGLPPVRFDGADDLGRHIEVLGLCESFLLFLQVATAAGPDLTRSTWVGALPGVGNYRPAYSDLARFAPRGKMTGGDTSKLIQWHANCTCWKELTPFGPSVG
ncbi:MAG TPA: hypothetical protein VM030_05450, partial [Acidimicrobiales bacterium]|nr:hypothetical protein [Acidimicrobiales bacterium]